MMVDLGGAASLMIGASRVTVDCYDGPLGQGYTLAEEVVQGAQTVRRVEQVGPEPWRASDWSTLMPFTGVKLGALSLSATFASIGIELPFTEAGGKLDAVEIEYRRAGTLAWKPALPLHLTAPTGQQAAGYGSIPLCDPGTAYNVRATARSAGAWTAVVGTVTTRREEIPPAATLVPTHFVRIGGSDANAGTSPATAWATIEKARAAAPAGAVVQVGPGHFVGQETAAGSAGRFQRITWVAEFPCLDDDGNAINQGKQTIVEGGLRCGPIGNGVVTEAPWTRVTLTGPVTGQAFAVWKWAGAGPAARLSLGYGATRDATPKRIAYWKVDTQRLATPAGWAELVATNRSQRSGYYQSGADLFLVMPVDLDPNALWWTAGTGCGFAVSAADCRVSGLVIRGFDRGIQFGPASDRFVVDHCRVETCNNGVFTIGSPPSTYPKDAVVERNALVNTGLWSDDQQADPAAAWVFIKDKIKLSDGTRYPTTRIGGAMEGVGVYLTSCRRAVVRHNRIEGYQNGIGSRIVQAFDRYASSEWDVHDNLIQKIQDDAVEPEGQAINWRIYRNRVEHTTTFISTAPVHFGPLYVFHNRGRIGMKGLARDLDGVVDGASSVFFKYSRASVPRARVYVVANTLIDDGTDGVSGGSQYASGAGLCEAYTLRNNVFRTSRNGWELHTGQVGSYVEDHNQFVTRDATRGMKNLTAQSTVTTFAAYKAFSGQGEGSNPLDLHDSAALDAQLNGDLGLLPIGKLTAAGCHVPTLCDLAAPDLGCPA